MDSPQDGKVKQIQVLSFEICGDTDCSFRLCGDEACEGCELSEALHTRIIYHLVPLQQGNAIALSYTWGEFDRRSIAICHDAAGNAVSMKLGREWTQPEFSTKLAALGYDRSPDGVTPMPLWIDQLSIRQDKDEELRRALASIPNIYSTLDVVALLPGLPCQCLQEGLDTYGGLEIRSIDELKLSEQMAAWAMQMKSCLNSTSFCSYFERLWTRQEMMYARKIQAHWTHQTIPPCVKYTSWDRAPLELVARFTAMAPYKDDSSAPPNGFEEPASRTHQDLAPFARLTFIEAQCTSVNSTNALLRTVFKRDESWEAALSAMQDYLAEDDAGTFVNTFHAFSTLCRFLGGQELVKKHSQALEDPELESYRQVLVFLNRLFKLGGSRRAATQARDYVAAIWVDCPQYQLPDGFKIIRLDALLQNAVLQLEQNFCFSIPVTAIAGLFGAEEATALWRPSCYLGSQRIKHVGQIYSVVRPTDPVEVTETGAVPILLHSPVLGRSPNLVDLQEYIGRTKPGDIVQDIREISSRWPTDVTMRAAHMEVPKSPNHILESRLKWRSALMNSNPIVETAISISNPQVQQVLSSLDVNDFAEPQLLYEAVYELVTQALGLDYETCRGRDDLYIALCLSQHPSIGLLSRSKTRTMDLPDSVTVCRDIIPPSSACTVLEAGRIGSSLYACGIWVPQMTTSITEIGGSVVEEGSNAIIV